MPTYDLISGPGYLVRWPPERRGGAVDGRTGARSTPRGRPPADQRGRPAVPRDDAA